MNDTPTPVRLEGLNVRYGAVKAVRDLSLSVWAGSVYALLGRNGSGKSSLVRCLLGQQRAASGQIHLLGEDAWRRRTRLMRRVGVVPEEPDAPLAMTARQLAAFCSHLYPTWDDASVAERLSRFAVPRGVPFGRLSKGQKGQLMLTLALGHRPELLVLDDPTIGLDVVARREFYEELVAELADRGATVLITTHDLAAVEGIATHVGILKDGELLVDEGLEPLKARFRTLRFGPERAPAAGELRGLGALAVCKTAWGLEAVVPRFDEAVAARLQAEGDVAVAVEAMSLEEIFSAVVGNGAGGEA